MELKHTQKGYTVKLSTAEWLEIGKKAGWITSQFGGMGGFCYGCQGALGSGGGMFGGRSYCSKCYSDYLAVGPDDAYPDVL